MDFALTPEQEELTRTLRAFAKKELAPRSGQWDKSGEFPWDAWRKMGELGLLGLRTPPTYGGQESDLLTMGIASEEIARGDFSCTYGIQLAGLAGEILGRNGTEEIKTRWLPPTARGETVIALALTEPGVGSDAANLACRAERDGDGYVITGEKSGISLGLIAQAAIVFARTDPKGRARGVTAFLVPLDGPGVAKSPLRDMGSHAVGRAVHEGIRDGEVVGAPARRGHHSPVPAPARALRLHRRVAVRAAAARRHRPGDRRRHPGNYEAGHRPGNPGPRISALLTVV